MSRQIEIISLNKLKIEQWQKEQKPSSWIAKQLEVSADLLRKTYPTYKGCIGGYKAVLVRKEYENNPKHCLYCKFIIPYKIRHNKFCSHSCCAKYNNQQRFNLTEEQSKKYELKRQNKKLGIRPIRISKSKSWAEKVGNKPFDSLKWDYKRQKILLEQDYKCAACGIKEWQGQQLSLEIDHKDGNNEHDTRENLHALCPNCHSLTKNFRGRNKLKGKFPVDRDFYERYKKENSIRQTLLSFGLAGKGANYFKAKIIIQRFEPQTSLEHVLVY